MDDKIILRKHDDTWQIVVSKNDYVLAESRDVIQLLPVDDKGDIRTFYKPFWKVVKQKARKKNDKKRNHRRIKVYS